MRYQYRYTKDEKRQLAAANRVLDDPTAPPREVNKALQHIQRIQDAAEGRAFDLQPFEPTPKEPTIDQLVSDLEKAEKPTLTNQQLTDHPSAENSVLAPPIATKALEVTQTLETAPVAFCAFCSTAGQWNTRFPVGQADGILLCPACFSKMCSADMLQTAAAARARAEQPADWAGQFVAQRNMVSSDFERSRAIWAEQDRAALDRQEQEARERARLEGQYNAARARWIQDGGKL